MSEARKSVQRKLTELILLSSFCALAVTLCCIVGYEIYSYRQATARSLSTLGEIVAENSAAVLIYDDQRLAGDILGGLRFEPEVSSAALFDKNGKLYTTYPKGLAATAFPGKIQPDGTHVGLSEIALWKPVTQANIRVGSLFIKGKLQGTYQRLAILASVLLLVGVAAVGIAFRLSQVLQSRVTQPLTELAAVARKVSSQKDYRIRASKANDDEIGDLTDALNSMLEEIHLNSDDLARARDEAVAASAAKDDFLARLSHELRTPLNPILLLVSDEGRNQTLPDDVRSDLEVIKTNVELEARLIDDLLDLTAVVRGKLPLQRRLVQINELVRDAIAKVAADAAQRSVKVRLHCDAHVLIVNGDPVRLQQVFWNVLKNAVKFSRANGTVMISTVYMPETKTVKVTIADDGMGMTAQELAKIFDAFAQGDHAAGGGSHRFGGLGLGLAIAQSVVVLHEGTIVATSGGRDKGSTFVVELPVAEAQNPLESQPGETPARLVPAPMGTGISILLVEDHEPTSLSLQRLLSRRQFDVVRAGSLNEARAAFLTRRIDLLISDIGLPDGSGYGLMAEFTKHRPIVGIALTGYGMEADVTLSREAGFAIHLTKPISVDLLDRALTTAVGLLGATATEPGKS